MKMEGDWLTSSVAVLNLCCGLSQKCNSEILGKKHVLVCHLNSAESPCGMVVLLHIP